MSKIINVGDNLFEVLGTQKVKTTDEKGIVRTDQVFRKEDNAVIPFDSANMDYQEYLEWVAEGNTPEEAD